MPRITPPKIGQIAESLTFDCKATYEKPSELKSQLEIAKDIAAFANSAGGCIFIGISEDKTTRLVAGYTPRSTAQQKELLDGIENAAEKHLRPRPLVAVSSLWIEDGGSREIIVVDIGISAVAPIGVLVPPVSGQTEQQGKAEPSYRFPFRRETRTIYLSPDQLSVIMDSKQRRIAAAIASIPESARGLVRVIKQSGGWVNAELVSVDLFANSLVVNARDAYVTGDKVNSKTEAYSLDRITTVYAAEDGVWHIALKDSLF